MFVNDLFEKEPRRSQEPRQSETDFGYRKLDPLIHKARQKYPLANNDTEALALYIADKEEADVQNLDSKVGSVNKNAQTLIQRQQQVLQKQNKELDSIEQELNATREENLRQERDIEQLVKGVNDANARYAAQEERFRDLTARVAAQKLTQTDVDAANIAKELEKADDARAKSFGAQQIVRNDVNEQGVAEGSLNEFAPPGSNDGDDGFSEETLKRLAAQWYNGDEDPRVERTLMAAGWEIGQDEGYDDEPGVFVVQAGDINGNSYLSWPAHELKQGVAEATESEIDKHLMEMRHAGYDISEGHGSYYCSTKKRMVQRKGPKQTRSSK